MSDQPERPEIDPADPPGQPPPAHPRHLAADRAGKGLLRAAHRITEGLAEAGVADDGVVVLRTDGPHRSLAGLAELIDGALAENAENAAEADSERRAEGEAQSGGAEAGHDRPEHIE